MGGSRWADTEEDAAFEEQRRRGKEEKRRQKVEKSRLAQQQQQQQQQAQKQQAQQREAREQRSQEQSVQQQTQRKRHAEFTEEERAARLLKFSTPGWEACGSADEYESLNSIEEGSYGWVSRGRCHRTGEIVALKKLKMEGSEHSGFPITALREIQCLMACRHDNIVQLRRVVMGKSLLDVYMVMEFLEHDLKTLMQDMREPFLPSETKTLMLQLVGAVEYLHANWMIHRDLKTSNILMDNRGVIKVADFGMARTSSNPAPTNLTQLVVTLWYRAPELLLGTTTYGFEIDVWSLGCIFGEFMTNTPLLDGSNEVSQLAKTFTLCGYPTDETWPGFRRLPNARTLKIPRDEAVARDKIRTTFPTLTNAGVDLMRSMLALNPDSRLTASEVLRHDYFYEEPRPKSQAMFPTFPSKAGGERRRRRASPSAPKRGEVPAALVDLGGLSDAGEHPKGAGFQLRVG